MEYLLKCYFCKKIGSYLYDHLKRSKMQKINHSLSSRFLNFLLVNLVHKKTVNIKKWCCYVSKKSNFSFFIKYSSKKMFLKCEINNFNLLLIFYLDFNIFLYIIYYRCS
ncbi:hypothetical protein EDEG_00212 [Edhazardia aedis USNM 41457]|uniref:Uncharacterized protein n=1 Tax=Edhazardia aedis (strain USNM 41457) TaxID=1003232 RepID=J8ZUF2_EDHAE|nr:hypothetical protein EDEG_00212 [Edhazardia aedis USNM 41457]|eukprot:EJW03303.1 hypothetical protein EDEG_00212 [Edhazardia aedis USNM 41457]